MPNNDTSGMHVGTKPLSENQRSSIWQLCGHNDHLQCHQWRQSCQIDDPLFSSVIKTNDNE